jgi:hypothetical protein
MILSLKDNKITYADDDGEKLSEKDGRARLKKYQNKPKGMGEREFADWLDKMYVPDKR